MNVVSPVAINVPVTDIDRALDLYRDCLGFQVTGDSGRGIAREVTLSAPGAIPAMDVPVA